MTDAEILKEFDEKFPQYYWNEEGTPEEHYHSLYDIKSFLLTALKKQREEHQYYINKIEILEKERDEWWSKADKPDECYVPMSVLDEKLKEQRRNK